MGTIEGLSIKILQIVGALTFVYTILMIGSKLRAIKSKKSALRTHYNILFGFFVGFLISEYSIKAVSISFNRINSRYISIIE